MFNGTILLLLLLLTLRASADVGDKGPWGDQGDGTYKNPILPGDFSDPDVIRVGKDYYLITSTFQYSPGVALLHSTDLVNWQYLSHAVPDITQITPGLGWDKMKDGYDAGIYAGSLRYHEGKYWIYFTTLGQGVFVTTAQNPAGPWTPLHLVFKVGGYDDPCPFWDDDGKAYLVVTHIGDGWKTHMYKMNWDGMSVDPASDFVVDAFHTSEGNKLYKINGQYYFFHNEVHEKRGERRVGVFLRSKDIYGPYEKKEVLHNRAGVDEKEPNQGGLVDTADGRWFFVTQQGAGSYEGRASHLLPVHWTDGWPIPGDIDADGIGTITWSAPKPIPESAPTPFQTSDEFNGPNLGPQWEWNFQPRDDHWSLTERPGYLRLKAFPPLANYDYAKNKRTPPGDLFVAGNTLSERLMGTDGGEVTGAIDVSHMADGEQGGLCFYWGHYAMLEVVQNGSERSIQLDCGGKITPGPALRQANVWMRANVDAEGGCTFAYSLDGKTFTAIGERFPFGWANYRGVRLGISNYNRLKDEGWLDVDYFRYSYKQ